MQKFATGTRNIFNKIGLCHMKEQLRGEEGKLDKRTLQVILSSVEKLYRMKPYGTNILDITYGYPGLNNASLEAIREALIQTASSNKSFVFKISDFTYETNGARTAEARLVIDVYPRTNSSSETASGKHILSRMVLEFSALATITSYHYGSCSFDADGHLGYWEGGMGQSLDSQAVTVFLINLFETVRDLKRTDDPRHDVYRTLGTFKGNKEETVARYGGFLEPILSVPYHLRSPTCNIIV